MREREENEEMRLGVGKCQREFQFPFSCARSEEFGTDPIPTKANDELSIDFNENMAALLGFYCSLFSNFILWPESLGLVSTPDNSFHTINLIQRNPIQFYMLMRFSLTQTDCM